MVKIKNILTVIAFYFSIMQSSDAVDVMAMSATGLHEENAKGAYDEILQKYPEVNRIFVQPAEVMPAFEKCVSCCISPFNKNPDFYDFSSDKYIVSEPMSVAKIIIITGKDAPIINSLEGLKGKKVGARTGIIYGKAFAKAKLDIVYVDSIEESISNLLNGKVDAFIAFAPDVFNTFEDLGIDPLTYDINHPIATHEDAILCKKTKETEEFINNFTPYEWQ